MRTARCTMKRTVVGMLLLGAGIVGMAGCSGEPAPDYVGTAENAIRANIQRDLGLEATVTCVPPASDEIGVTFTCNAVASDGTTYDFDFEISGTDEVTMSLDV